MAYINKAEILFSAKIGVGDATPDLQQKTVTPSKETQIVTPDANYDGLSKVTVNPIPEGSGEGAELTSLKLVTFENNKTITPDAGKDGFSKVEVAYTEDEKTVTPNENTQYIFPDDGKVLKMVTVNPIPPNSGSDVNVQMEKMQPLTSDADGYVSPSTIYPDDGYDAMDSVVVYFPEPINASKIKKGEKILGVTGTYEASGNSIIVGKWVFHNVVTQYPPETVFDVNFKCDDNTECNRIATSVANSTWQMVFWDADDGAMFDAVVDGQFRNVAYQTIDFGTEPQTIPTEFATWLAANADYKSGEDLSTELAEQNTLISDIKTALANKAAGGGNIETCNFTIHRNSMALTQQCIPYIDSNGKLDAITGAYALEDTGDISFNVPKNAVIMLNVGVAETPVFEEITDDMNMSWINGVYFYKITGDVEITIG